MASPISMQPLSAQPLPLYQWKTRMLDFCSDPAECAYACVCLPCYEYETFENAGEGLRSCCCGTTAQLRSKVRVLRGIEGNLFRDCLAGYCCTLCTLLQINNEVRA